MDKKLIYGTFSAIAILLVMVALIFVNLVAEKFDVEVDLTSQEKYTISDTSKEALQKVEKDINIYVLSKTGEEDKTVKQILGDYKNNCPKLTVEYKDPYIYPTFAKDFAKDGEEIENDSIIISSENKSRVISPQNLYETSYANGAYQVTGIKMESEITNAIRYVSSSETPIIYYLSGHNEMPVAEILKSELSKINYEIKTLNIAKDGGIPKDCTMLFLTTPQKDYTEQETDQILTYLANDGKAMMFLDWGEDTPNLNKVLSAYGVKTENSMIIENDKSHYYNAPMFILPDIQPNEMTEQLQNSDYLIMFPYSQAISQVDLKKNSLNIESLFKTSTSAYSKTSKEPKSINFEEGDKKGPFDLAVAITDSYYTDKNHTTKLVVCGSSLIIREEGFTQGSLLFVVNALNWLRGEESSVYIPPKSIETETLVIPEGTQTNIVTFACGVIPVIIFGIGIYVWYKRRYS